MRWLQPQGEVPLPACTAARSVTWAAAVTWIPPSGPGRSRHPRGGGADRRTNPELYSLDPDDVLTRVLERTDGSTGPSCPAGATASSSSWVAGRGRPAQRAGRPRCPSRRRPSWSLPTGWPGVEADATYADDLIPPIVIVGGWRTGTTFLFRLMA